MKKRQYFRLVLGFFSVVILFFFLKTHAAFLDRFFSDYSDYKEAYNDSLHVYEKAEMSFREAERAFSKACLEKLQVRCQYVKDQLFDFEGMDDDVSLFCQQAECHRIFAGNLNVVPSGIDVRSCQTHDGALNHCVNGESAKRQAFRSLGMKKGRAYLYSPKVPFEIVEKMVYAQNEALDRGLTIEEAHKLVHQIQVENSRWTVDGKGDQWCRARNGAEDYCFRFQRYGMPIKDYLHSCSLGLVQFNTCAHHRVDAETFYRANSEWHDYRFQIDKLITFLVEKKKEYKGDFDRARVAWNYPSASAKGFYKDVRYYRKLNEMAERFEDENDEFWAIEMRVDEFLD